MKTFYSLFVVLALIVSCGELDAEVDGSWILDQEVTSASCEKLGVEEDNVFNQMQIEVAGCLMLTSIWKEISISGDRVEMSGDIFDKALTFNCSHDVSNQKFLCPDSVEFRYSLEGERLVLELRKEDDPEGTFYKAFFNQK